MESPAPLDSDMAESSGVWAVAFTGHGGTSRATMPGSAQGIYLPGIAHPPSPTQLQSALPHWTERLSASTGEKSLLRGKTVLIQLEGHLLRPEEAAREVVVFGLSRAESLLCCCFPWPFCPTSHHSRVLACVSGQYSELSRTLLAPDHQGPLQPSDLLGKPIGTLTIPQRALHSWDYTTAGPLLLLSVSETLHGIMAALGIKVYPPYTERCGLPELGALGLSAD